MAVTGVRSREPIFPMETARSSKCEDNIEGGSMRLMCIILSFTILFVGCYSSELIDLNGEDIQVSRSTEQETHSTEQRTYPSEIEYVVTRDGKQYHFDTPPTIVNYSIGNVSLTEIEYVITKDGTKHTFDESTGSIITPIDKVKANSTMIDHVVMKDGIVYLFEGATAVVNDTIVGVLKAKAMPGFANDPTARITTVKGTTVFIALSDVAEGYMTEYDPGMTAVVVVVIVGGLVLLGYVALGSMNFGSFIPDLGGN
jgi:hypothetical protein